MAVPALLGIGALSAFLSEAIKAVISWLFTKAAKRIIYFGLIVTAIYAAISTFFNAVSGFFSSLLSGMPPEIGYIGYALPSNTDTCISAVIALEVAGITYSFVMRMINVKLAVLD